MIHALWRDVNAANKALNLIIRLTVQPANYVELLPTLRSIVIDL